MNASDEAWIDGERGACVGGGVALVPADRGRREIAPFR
jgi:hypothetical protein